MKQNDVEIMGMLHNEKYWQFFPCIVAGYKIRGYGDILPEDGNYVTARPARIVGKNRDIVMLGNHKYDLARVLVESLRVPPPPPRFGVKAEPFFMPGEGRGLEDIFWRWPNVPDEPSDWPNVGYSKVKKIKGLYYELTSGGEIRRNIGCELYKFGDVVAKIGQSRWLNCYEYAERIYGQMATKAMVFGRGTYEGYDFYHLPDYCVVPFGDSFGGASRIDHKHKVILVSEHEYYWKIEQGSDGTWELVKKCSEPRAQREAN